MIISLLDLPCDQNIDSDTSRIATSRTNDDDGWNVSVTNDVKTDKRSAIV